jgi:hypothetical protein
VLKDFAADDDVILLVGGPGRGVGDDVHTVTPTDVERHIRISAREKVPDAAIDIATADVEDSDRVVSGVVADPVVGLGMHRRSAPHQ